MASRLALAFLVVALAFVLGFAVHPVWFLVLLALLFVFIIP
jgi:hypothetical protein